VWKQKEKSMPQKLGFERYKSNSSGQVFASFKAAQNDEREQEIRAANNSEGAKILESLSTEQLRAVTDELARQHAQLVGHESGERAVRLVLSENSDYVDSAKNSGALQAHLRARGASWPYSEHELRKAISELRQLGVLDLQGKPPEEADVFDQEAAEKMSTQELYERSMGWK
jgi:hypothetical protein